MKLVDLTHPINNQTPVYPGDPAVKIETSSAIPQDGSNDNLLVFGTHVGIHIDAPGQVVAGL